MGEPKSPLKGKRILVVDDEEDILATIVDILEDARVDTARDYAGALQKIKEGVYDLAILDIMGVNGLSLLDETVARGIPTVMLTAHAMNPETLMESIQRGAISYLPKETMAELDVVLGDLLSAHERGEPAWRSLFDKLGSFFDQRFGPKWKEKNQRFWSKFDASFDIGKGIQKRLEHDDRFKGKF